MVIGDDQQLFVEALATILGQQGFDVLSVAHSLTETVAAVNAKQPDVSLIEQGAPNSDWIEGVESIISACPAVKVVVLSVDGSAEGIARAIERGAVGYVHKTNNIATLTETLRRVMDGEIVVDARPGACRRRLRDPMDPERMAAHLTARERECLQLLVEGLDTRAMADRLGIAITTVRSHVQATLTKLGTHSRLEAAALAVRYDLLSGVADGKPPSTSPERTSEAVMRVARHRLVRRAALMNTG